jgi:hypothetical protein
MGAIDEILAGRLTSGTLIAIFRLIAGAGAAFAVFSVPFLLTFAADGADFLLLAGLADTLLVLTFFVAPLPLVDVRVAVFLAGFFFTAILAAFFPEAAVFDTFFLLTFFLATFFFDAAGAFFVDVFLPALVLAPFLALAFLAPAFLVLAFLRLALGDAFFLLLPAAFLLTTFFRAAMLSAPASVPESGVCKMADYT